MPQILDQKYRSQSQLEQEIPPMTPEDPYATTQQRLKREENFFHFDEASQYKAANKDDSLSSIRKLFKMRTDQMSNFETSMSL